MELSGRPDILDHVKWARIGVTSPLSGDDVPPANLGAVQYCHSLEKLGAQAVLLRNSMAPTSLIGKLDLRGLVFSGGGDVAAGRYGGDESLARYDVDVQRDNFEFTLMEQALALKLPILATCRGMEVANVVLGGTLIGDLRHHLGERYLVTHHQVDDRGLSYSEFAHKVTVEPGTLLHGVAECTTFPVNSMHHQAIEELGKGLIVVARSTDGMIEAVELAGYPNFFLAVQWHPEWLPDDPISRRILARLVEAAEGSRSGGFQDVC